MKTIITLSWVTSLFIFGCRADLAGPERNIDWENVTDIQWEIAGSTNLSFIPVGGTFLFGSENEFRGFLPGRQALCGEWQRGGSKATVQYEGGRERLVFDVTDVSQDSLSAVLNLGNLSSKLQLVREERVSDDFNQLAAQEPNDYTVTDTTGRIERTDTYDWMTNPEYVCQINVQPLYPNPVSPGGIITLPVEISAPEATPGRLSIASRWNAFGNFEIRNIGAYRFQFDASQLNSGLHRLFIFDQHGRIVSFGDVSVR